MIIKEILTFFRKLGPLLIIINFFLLIALPSQLIASEPSDTIKLYALQEKIAKSYSNKFCNAIGIGISKEGATRLTINENKESKFNPSLWFELASSGKTNIELIDQDELAELISNRIIKDCGLAIGLSGQKGVESFKSFFIDIRDNKFQSTS